MNRIRLLTLTLTPGKNDGLTLSEISPKYLKPLAIPAGFEPATHGVEIRYSINSIWKKGESIAQNSRFRSTGRYATTFSVTS